MPYLTEFIIVAIAHLLAVISPGPDFALITRNSLVFSRRTGVYASIGLALGILVHITYSLVGIGLIIVLSAWVVVDFIVSSLATPGTYTPVLQSPR